MSVMYFHTHIYAFAIAAERARAPSRLLSRGRPLAMAPLVATTLVGCCCLVANVYYALVDDALTTLAHAAALALGATTWAVARFISSRRHASR